MNKLPLAKTLLIAAAIAFAMLLTRGSHVLTQVSLPDASLALFLLGGLYLSASLKTSELKTSAAWFAAFFALATFIEFGAAALDPAQGFCLILHVMKLRYQWCKKPRRALVRAYLV